MKIHRQVVARDLYNLKVIFDCRGLDLGWLIGSPNLKKTKDESKEPIQDAAIAILIRLYTAYPELYPLPIAPTYAEIHEKIVKYGNDTYQELMHSRPVTRGRMPEEPSHKFSAMLFGRGAWTGNNWAKSPDSKPIPVIERLFLLFDKMVNEYGMKGFEMFIEIVQEEAYYRGVENMRDLFNNPWKEDKA